MRMQIRPSVQLMSLVSILLWTAIGQGQGATSTLVKSGKEPKASSPSAWEELSSLAQQQKKKTPEENKVPWASEEFWTGEVPPSEVVTNQGLLNSMWDEKGVDPDEGDGVEDQEETNVQTQAEWEELIAKKSAPKKPEPKKEDNSIGSKVAGFPSLAFQQALAYFNKNKGSFSNKTYITVIDFTKPSHKKRMFIVNLKTGGVEARLTTHGKGSDPRHSGYAKKFSNSHGSNATSLGFYRTLGMYRGNNGPSLRLQGLSKTNSQAQGRAIVMHKAKYVSERGGRAGRSNGCFAMDPSVYTATVNKLKGGSLLYAWSGQK